LTLTLTPPYPTQNPWGLPYPCQSLNQQEDNTEQLMLWNIENNPHNLGENSHKMQDYQQPRKDPHPPTVKYLSQNTSLTHKGNQSHPPLSMLCQLHRFPLPQTYLFCHLFLVLLISILLPSPLGTPQTPDCQNSLMSRSCVVATF